MNEKASLSASAGIYYQNIPLYFLSQNSDFKLLKDPVSYHYVLGLSNLISDDTRMTVEIYNKEYKNCPIDPAQPQLYILDEAMYDMFYSNHENLVDTGNGYTRGIEIMVQKKLSDKFYGIISGTYFRSRYRDHSGVWRNRITDNRYLFALEGGYKPNNKWEFSLRWSAAGGIPYTPFDEVKSSELQHGVYDDTKIMSERLPGYSCLNIRFDRRFHFSGSNLIFYLSIWNFLNKRNFAYHHWAEYQNTAANYTQWPRLPVFGFEYEF